ncbi:AGE family epimerase/isomerase [Stappia sp. F7233]|uniref:AGE family epimerase/isomerase n=1 Tax=Stappia albiluteola TaxID=2758565 RepID=A0A839AA74_9HYPH|nr:AGE family epimerase/isomerase [Stappia albiluteola]MBA5776321.1 AGE family epimerase/isomerase [Stappia albiluteola]
MEGEPANAAALKQAGERLRRWLLEAALPLWLDAGQDAASGRYFEALDIHTGEPVRRPTRARVPPRQVYSFLAGAELGGRDDWRRAAEVGLDRYLTDFTSEAGLMVAACDLDGTVVDAGIDLYDQAFALFALAEAATAFPERKTEFSSRSGAMLSRLRSDLGHPLAGFEEAHPRRLPLRSNPHMHLFEAALAWEELEPAGPWAALSDEIAGLALTCFIDRDGGYLREFFDGDFRPMADASGRIVEPGHQFEWAWLLTRWGVSRGNGKALSAARRLFEIGGQYGIDRRRGVAVMQLADDFSVRDPVARLWGQTEWIKAALILARISAAQEREYYLASAVQAVAALERFFDEDRPGLWRDKLTVEDRFIDEPAPASSLYHIVCAVLELCR